MRDIWNPWHGCKRVSEGCKNCYMYFLDAKRDKFGGDIFRVKNNFDYPIWRDKFGNFKVPSGSTIRVCMTSDFFLEEADEWRDEAWQIMKARPDVIFYLLTKRPERVAQHLPKNWGDGWENIWFNVTAENQKMADFRIPILLELPFKHKGIMAAPFVGKISIKKYLESGQIESVWSDGENYGGARPLFYEWVKLLSDECKECDVEFVFCGIGNFFVKDGKVVRGLSKIEQTKYAYDLGLNYESTRKQNFKLKLPSEQLTLFDESEKSSVGENDVFQKSQTQDSSKKYFREHCKFCPTRRFCFGCTNCGKCES